MCVCVRRLGGVFRVGVSLCQSRSVYECLCLWQGTAAWVGLCVCAFKSEDSYQSSFKRDENHQRDPLYYAVEQLFPPVRVLISSFGCSKFWMQLLQLANHLSTLNTMNAAHMLYELAKAFFYSIQVKYLFIGHQHTHTTHTPSFSLWPLFIQFNLPPLLNHDANLEPWMVVFMKLVERTQFADAAPSVDDAEVSCWHRHPSLLSSKKLSKWPWWKAKKWAVHIFHRLYQR